MFSQLTIRKQMLFIAFLTIAAIMALLLFNYNQTARLVTEKNEAATNDIFLQIKQTVGSNHDIIKALAYNIGYNKTVQDLLLTKPEALQNEDLAPYEQINNLLFNLSTLNSGILDLVIQGGNGLRVSLNSGINDIESFGSSVSDSRQSVYSGLKGCFAGGGPIIKSCLVVGTTVYSNVPYDRYTEKIGSVYVIVDPVLLVGGGKLQTKQEGTTILLLDRDEKIFLSTDKAMLGQTFDLRQIREGRTGLSEINGQLTHIQVDELPQLGGHMVRLMPDNVFYRDVRLLRKWSFTGIVIGLGLLSIPFFLILNNVIAPLRALYTYMKFIKPADLNKAIQLRGSSEAEAIAKQFNQMMEQIRELTSDLVESKGKLLYSEIEMKRAEYAFLKSQVNPHFLYNTLDAIRGIALERKVPEINEVTKALSRIFRYSVKGNDTVTLQEELNIVRDYMHIQSIRFANRFELEIDVAEHHLPVPVPKMILQPIVENAVYHGLEPRSGKGRLSITSRNGARHDLTIRISDNGAGMTEDKLRRIASCLEKPEAAGSGEGAEGIGIRNVHNRLKIIYGNGYGLELESNVDIGTVVELNLPMHTGGDHPV